MTKLENQAFVISNDYFERPIAIRDKVYANYSEFMNAFEQYPDDEEYEDEEYEYESDDDDEQVYATSTSLIKGFLNKHEPSLPKNQEHIWEDDIPAGNIANKPLVQSPNRSWVQQEKAQTSKDSPTSRPLTTNMTSPLISTGSNLLGDYQYSDATSDFLNNEKYLVSSSFYTTSMDSSDK